MKKLFFILTIIAAGVMAKEAQALDDKTAYMVTGNGSHTLSLDPNNGHYRYDDPQTPWVYLKLKLENLALSSPLHLHYIWTDKSDPDTTQTVVEKLSLTGLTTDEEIWRPIPQPWWNAAKHQGEWQVDVNWFNVHGTDGVTTANFDFCKDDGGIIITFRSSVCGSVPVVPEPLSTSLFLLGGAPVAFGIFRKKFQKG